MANAGIADPDEQLLFEDPPNYERVENPKPPGLRTYETNLTGVLYTAHLALSYLSRNPGSEQCSLESNEGKRDRHLLLVASIAGLAGVPGQPLYVAAKHGVVGLFRTLGLTSPMKTGVRVNMINPCTFPFPASRF
jgi:NAD(P)-dependent dehydrogenase (short-subunit alcohol dehydrogenase family)